MAERIQVELVDDVDGSPANHTVTFALDGVTYEIDLNDAHAQQLRAVLNRYVKAARSPKPEPRT
ncbi:Lsr2 dimerization domain-containing protein [Saccharopolyspora spinosa]|uniref:histone-like nucleoid-structuring protein Lsr2 n=1 Tax=Saccharopolyspora spinosa TaxID=60894 RepID=UPI000A058BB4